MNSYHYHFVIVVDIAITNEDYIEENSKIVFMIKVVRKVEILQMVAEVYNDLQNKIMTFICKENLDPEIVLVGNYFIDQQIYENFVTMIVVTIIENLVIYKIRVNKEIV